MIDRKFSAVAGIEPPRSGLQTLLLSSTVSSLKGPINGFLEWFGDLGIFFWRVVRAAVTPPFEFRELFRQLDEIGSMSLPVVALAGAATGVLGLSRCYPPLSCSPSSTRPGRSSPVWL
jgi:hypothetical protein